MYDQKLVKKRRRKTAAAIISGISLMGVGALAIVAFLGRFVGTFTVSLNTGDVELSLSETEAFEEPTSFLMINTLPPYGEYTYSEIYKESAFLDSEEAPFSTGMVKDKNDPNKFVSTNYFKYTFFVKNTGSVTAGYDFQLKILENKASDDGRSLLDTIRVAIYENDVGGEEKHESKVYAKRSYESHTDEEGKKTYKEYISTSKMDEDDNHPCFGLAEMFESEQRITTLSVNNFKKDDIKRYTIITWLEGEDPSSNNDVGAPKGATIKLGVEINAYENE